MQLLLLLLLLYSIQKSKADDAPPILPPLTLRMASEMMGGASLVWIHFSDQYRGSGGMRGQTLLILSGPLGPTITTTTTTTTPKADQQ